MAWLALALQVLDERFEAEPVAPGTEPRNNAQGDGRHIGSLPEGLAGIDIREMDFHDWKRGRNQRVPERHARMGETTGIDQDRRVVAHGLLNPIDQLTLMVGLKTFNLDTDRLGRGRQLRIKFGQGLGPIDLGLTLAEQVQIRSMDNENSNLVRFGYALTLGQIDLLPLRPSTKTLACRVRRHSENFVA